MILIFILLALLLVILFVITSILNKYYVITNVGSILYYQMIDANTLENDIDKVNDYLNVDERNYLDINIITFVLFLLYVSCVKYKAHKNFFDTYFTKHYKTIVY